MSPASSLVGGVAAAAGAAAFRARNPATGAEIEPVFHAAARADLERAAALAAAAAPAYGRLPGRERGAFLRAIAAGIEQRAAALVARAAEETALPSARLQGETARTCAQLRLFAALVEEGSWVEARLDAAQQPPPPGARQPDLRSLLRPLGPVAVFGASNFPLAFSVAGGDTASALAAGCPVVVKAHPAHPGTSLLAGEAIVAAAAACGLEPGVFALLFDAGLDIGRQLVQHPAIRAVGFTGSLAAGRQLMDLAAARPQPIPVYAEMGSTNPVFVLPGALAERGADIASGLHQSVTLGAGQFCTKPGVVFLPPGAAGESLAAALADKMRASPGFTLLTDGIARSYRSGAAARAAHAVVRAPAGEGAAAGAMLFAASAAQFLDSPELGEELFGPAAVLVRAASHDELLQLARGLQGHLTATVHATPRDLEDFADLVPILEQRVGRIIFNGYPTGVAVTSAMVHAGPYPASSFPETSVGTRAIRRFARPVCFQDAPAAVLPAELQDANPLGLWRLRDGVMGRD